MKASQCTLTDSKDRISNCYWQNYYLTKGYVLIYGEGSVMQWVKPRKDQKLIWTENISAYKLGDYEVIISKNDGIDFCHMHNGCGTEKEITYK